MSTPKSAAQDESTELGTSSGRSVDRSTIIDNSTIVNKSNKSSNPIAFYKKKIEAITQQLMEFNENLSPEKMCEFEEEELTVRLEMLEKIHNNFEKVQTSLEQEEFEEIDSDSRSITLNLYVQIKAKFLREINLRNRAQSNREGQLQQADLHSTLAPLVIEHRRSNLPELQVPKFSGSYTDWPDFYALFCTVIHNNGDLSKIEKFQHLRSALQGAALDTIRSLEPNDVNYDIAIQLLKKRFDNKLLNFQVHIKAIFDLKNVERGSAEGLRELSDKVKAHQRALSTMATKEQLADGLLINILCQKMDPASKNKWEESLSHNELPRWLDLENFLDKRCCALENMQSAVAKPKATKIANKRASYSSNTAGHSCVAAAVHQQCAFCNSKEHAIYNCNLFRNLSPKLRRIEVKKLNLCYNCLRKGHAAKACKSSRCRKCKELHHSLLHIVAVEQPTQEAAACIQQVAWRQDAQAPPPVAAALTASPPAQPDVYAANYPLLATAIINVKSRSGVYVPCRALLDSASQINFITSRLANQLQLKCSKSSTHISGICQSGSMSDKVAHVSAQSQLGDHGLSFTAVVTSCITDYQPNAGIDVSNWNIPGNITLADPMFFKPRRIDILIGADQFFNLLCVGQVILADNLPVLQQTRLGWIVAGGSGRSSSKCTSLLSSADLKLHKEEDNLEAIVKGFWEIENDFCPAAVEDADSIFCEQHFLENHSRLSTGEFSVRLPKQHSVDELGESFYSALHRFKRLEQRLYRQPELWNQYSAFMQEYANLKHMSPAEFNRNTPTYFLPHHCVLKAESTTTKLRVVFDGSAKTSSGRSLNDLLYAGPPIQPKLFTTLLRFRRHKIALTADICKMYRCVRVTYPDNMLQCIVWRNSTQDEIQVYKLDTVTYGTKPAAFLAIRAMHQLAVEEEDDFPVGAKIVRRDFYVDDLISGGESLKEVIDIQNQTTQLLQRGNFMLRKWCSNDPRVLQDIPAADHEKLLAFHDGTSVTKALGLVWDPATDNFMFSFSPQFSQNASKRTVLATIARFYDPLGLIGPIISKAKIFMQNLWRQNLGWDDDLPQALQRKWEKLCCELQFVDKFEFPRFVLTPDSASQIHAFCDASLNAYGACIYIRSKNRNGAKTQLLCSKSRVSPLKQLTVPKLELSAAHLMVMLLDTIVATEAFGCEIHCWTDSTVVLSWLRKEPSTLNVFVSNRVRQIQAFSAQTAWHHVSTELNPADILSRGATAKELLNSSLWKHGPPFLHGSEIDWPKQPELLEKVPECRQRVLLSTIKYDASAECRYRNSFATMQRIYAYVYRFCLCGRSLQERRSGPLLPIDLKMGTRLLVRMIQRIYLEEEYNLLGKNKLVQRSSRLFSLNPFIDEFGLLRVGGRLHNSSLDFDARHPMILPKHHPITAAIILHFHKKLLHAGPQALLASIRLQFWPIGGRKLVASIISKCVICFRLKPRMVQHIMGNLPSNRVAIAPTFSTTGVDFCGPFYFKPDVRNRPPQKCYICIFICFSTKATHLELVEDLSTSAFIAALNRFICTRGKPHTIWSDNATNFVGAKGELADLQRLFLSQIHQDAVHKNCVNEGIDWRTIPPRSPHFGGLWEAAVKAAKYHYYRAIGSAILTFEELRTLVCQIGAIINSRPLFPLTENPSDLDVLTPAHFLIGRSFADIAEPDVTALSIGRMGNWQRVCCIKQNFWKRWSASYLTLLQERGKWNENSRNLVVGSMVLIKDDNAPPMRWPLGRVVDTIIGRDGVARIAFIKTAAGVVKRAVAKLAALPTNEEIVEGPHPSTGGGCSEQPQFNENDKSDI